MAEKKKKFIDDSKHDAIIAKGWKDYQAAQKKKATPKKKTVKRK